MRLAYAFILSMAVFLCAACQRQEVELRIGVNAWPGYAGLFLARDLGRLDEGSRLVEFSSGNDTLQAFRNGAIDAAGVTLDEAIQLAAQGNELRIVAVFYASHGADMLLARPSIRKLKELKGRRIGVEGTALGVFMLSHALQAAGLERGDVEAVHLLPMEQEAAYRAGRIDAAVTYEPYARGLVALGAQRLFDTRQIPGEIVGVLVVRERFLADHPREVAKLVAAVLFGQDYPRQSAADARARMARRAGQTVAEFSTSLEGIQLMGSAENREYFAGDARKLAGVLDHVHAEMLREGFIRQPLDFARLPEPRLVQGITR